MTINVIRKSAGVKSLCNTIMVLFLILLSCSASSGGEYAQTNLAEQIKGNTKDHRIENGHAAIDKEEKSESEPTQALSSTVKAEKDADRGKDANNNTNKWLDWFDAFGPKTWSNWVLVIVGGLYTGFAALQWRAIRLALNVERPYMFIEEIKLNGFYGSHEPKPGLILPGLHAVTKIRNHGKGPAIIREIQCAINIVDKEPPPDDFSDCVTLEHPGVLGPNKILRRGAYFGSAFDQFTQPQRDLILADGWSLIVYGFIKYSSLFRRDYRRVFYWKMEKVTAVLIPSSEPVMLQGTAARNYDEEEKPN